MTRKSDPPVRKIAFVGTASSGAKAPYDDPSWEIWGVSARPEYVTRATRWFEIHRLDGEPQDWANAWRESVRTFSKDVELMMFYPEPDLGPNVVKYPVDRIVDRFGTFFMSSTFAWMMALALDEVKASGVRAEFAVYGVDMEYGTEYAQQRAGFRHFVALARDRGIPVHMLASTGLAYDPVPYPMWQDDPLLNKLELRHTETQRRLQTLNESLRRTRTLIAQNVAVTDELRRLGGHSGRLAELASEHKSLMETSASLSKEIVHWDAINSEQDWLADYLKA